MCATRRYGGRRWRITDWWQLRGSYSYTGGNNVDPVTSTTALNDEQKLHGLAFGGGLMYGGQTGFGLSLDYAYKYLGILGPTNFFSFTLGW